MANKTVVMFTSCVLVNSRRAGQKNLNQIESKVVLLSRTIGQRRNDMFDAFTWDADADRQIYQTVVDKFNSFCAPRVNVVAMTHKVPTQKKRSVNDRRIRRNATQCRKRVQPGRAGVRSMKEC